MLSLGPFSTSARAQIGNTNSKILQLLDCMTIRQARIWTCIDFFLWLLPTYIPIMTNMQPIIGLLQRKYTLPVNCRVSNMLQIQTPASISVIYSCINTSKANGLIFFSTYFWLIWHQYMTGLWSGFGWDYAVAVCTGFESMETYP